MSLINDIRAKISGNQFEVSKHAADRALLRDIRMHEVQEAISNGEVIEDYPDDKYGPSCLVFGWTRARRPLHIQCSYPSRPLIKIITLYEPDPSLWIDLKTRRSEHGE